MSQALEFGRPKSRKMVTQVKRPLAPSQKRYDHGKGLLRKKYSARIV